MTHGATTYCTLEAFCSAAAPSSSSPYPIAPFVHELVLPGCLNTSPTSGTSYRRYLPSWKNNKQEAELL